MTAEEQQSFGFSSTNGRRVAGKFDGGDISSDGGLMLVREADRKLAVGVHEVLVENFIASFPEPPEEIILDFDATDDPVHGHQEGRFFHGYYDRYCFLPLYVFCNDILLVAYLRESGQDVAKHAAAILKLLVKRIRLEWPKVKIIISADSGFCRDRILSWCDRHGVDYIIGVARNAVLLAESERYLDEAERLFKESEEKQRIFGGLIYGAKSWRRKRHVICKAEHTDKGSNPRFVVTSLTDDDAELYDKVYCARGEMENRIKEQMMLFSDRTSAHRWWPNQWRVLLSALAYTLLESIRRIGLKGTIFAKTQCHGIRLKLIKIGTLIERTKSRVLLHMPSGYPHKLTFIKCLKRLRPT